MRAQDQQILQSWFSPAYPVGGFSYSHGLEAAVVAGDVSDTASLLAWLDAVVRHGAARSDAILLAHTYAHGPLETADLASALATSRERHLETWDQGRAFARVTRDVHHIDVADAPFPVAVGVAARALKLPLEDTVRHYLHAMMANLVSAAVRFVPLGQTDGQRALAGLFPQIAETATRACGAGLEDLGSMVPGADLAAMEHETLSPRIFRT
ncbi:MAG: urease accessory UreF family protein [Pseudomonadota bacterium]